tara:strand:- start:420 stop:539 length:120 start_codon:yes stop_codon:yes gene_type:complete
MANVFKHIEVRKIKIYFIVFIYRSELKKQEKKAAHGGFL